MIAHKAQLSPDCVAVHPVAPHPPLPQPRRLQQGLRPLQTLAPPPVQITEIVKSSTSVSAEHDQGEFGRAYAVWSLSSVSDAQRWPVNRLGTELDLNDLHSDSIISFKPHQNIRGHAMAWHASWHTGDNKKQQLLHYCHDQACYTSPVIMIP